MLCFLGRLFGCVGVQETIQVERVKISQGI